MFTSEIGDNFWTFKRFLSFLIVSLFGDCSAEYFYLFFSWMNLYYFILHFEVRNVGYQARGKKYRYWYYQLKAPEAIFLKTNSENEYSRYQHLGSSGSEAHINGVLAVVRRVQIDELTKAIDGLKESWLDLYSDDKKVGNRVQ
jgi:hypothetical protein